MESIHIVDPGNNRRKDYAKDLMKNLDFMKNKDILMSNVFDPKFILIDNVLNDKAVMKCNFST